MRSSPHKALLAGLVMALISTGVLWSSRWLDDQASAPLSAAATDTGLLALGLVAAVRVLSRWRMGP